MYKYWHKYSMSLISIMIYRLFNYMKKSIALLLLLCASKFAFGNTEQPLLLSFGDQAEFHQYLSTMRRDGIPTNFISFQYLFLNKNNRMTEVGKIELKCQNREIRIGNSEFINTKNDSNTLRKIITHGVCGVSQDDNYWILFHTNTQGQLHFIDANSVVYAGDSSKIYFKAGIGSFNFNNLSKVVNIMSYFDTVISCTDISISEKRAEQAEYPNPTVYPSNFNASILAKAVCNGYFPIGAQKETTPIPKPSIDRSSVEAGELSNKSFENSLQTAKDKCIQIGLKPGNDIFGKCVLEFIKK